MRGIVNTLDVKRSIRTVVTHKITESVTSIDYQLIP